MNKKIILIFVFLLTFTILAGNVHAQENNNKVNVYFFGLSTCPYCALEKAHFEDYLKTDENVNVYYFELDSVKENAKLLLAFGDAFNERSTSVPITFISEKTWIGYNEDISNQIHSVIDNCKINECKDSMDYLTDKEQYLKYITDDKYYIDLSKEQITTPKEKTNIFKKIFLFIKNIFTKN